MHPGPSPFEMWAGAYQAAINISNEAAQRSENYAYLHSNISRMELERLLVDTKCAHADAAAQNIALRAELATLERTWAEALREDAAVDAACRANGAAL